jgi:hypothetical protein
MPDRDDRQSRFAETYSRMSSDELQRVMLERATLIPQAAAALELECARRGLDEASAKNGQEPRPVQPNLNARAVQLLRDVARRAERGAKSRAQGLGGFIAQDVQKVIPEAVTPHARKIAPMKTPFLTPSRMKTPLLTPFRIGVLTFLLVYAVALVVAGPLTCSDGWHSPSIGKQGACSSHGGVNGEPRRIALIASIGAGFGAAELADRFVFWRKRKALNREAKQRKGTTE